MNQKRKSIGQSFKAELKVKPLPAAVEEYTKQYLINLALQGWTIIAPTGYSIGANNIKEALEKWNEAE